MYKVNIIVLTALVLAFLFTNPASAKTFVKSYDPVSIEQVRKDSTIFENKKNDFS